MSEVEKKYFIAPSGRPFVAEITRDEHAYNPEQDYEEHGTMILESHEFEPYLHGARERWVSNGRDALSIDGAEFLRYLRAFQRDQVRIAAAICRSYYDGSIVLDFAPDRGQRVQGLFVLTHEDVARMSDGGDPAWFTDERLRELMNGRAETYTAWATGDTYAVEVRTFSEVGLPFPDESDGPTGGYYGMSDAESAILSALPDGTREVSEDEYDEQVAAGQARRAAVDVSDLDTFVAELKQAKQARIAAAELTWQG
jgi:hypothetical protein